MDIIKILQASKDLLKQSDFSIGIFVGIISVIILNALKKQIEKIITDTISKGPSFIHKLILFRNWEKKYLRTVAEEHKYIKLIGIKRNIAINPPKLEDVYVNLELSSPALQDNISHLRPSISLQESFFLHTALEKFNYIAILGHPGTGKTTLLEHLVSVYAENFKNKKFKNRLLPIYIPLRRCLLNGRAISEELTDKSTGLISPELLNKYPKNYFQSKLEKGKCILLFDGLDEVLSEDKHIAAIRLVESCITLYSKCKIILTSRIAGWRNILGSQVARFIIRELSFKEIGRLVNQWYLAVYSEKYSNNLIKMTQDVKRSIRKDSTEQANKILQVIKINERLKEIASTPLILSLMCLVFYIRHDLPEKRALLYEHCLKVLLDEWDQYDKNIYYEKSLSYDNKSRLIQKISVLLFRYNSSEISKQEIENIIDEFLKEKDIKEQKPSELLKHIEQRSGIILERAINKYGFAHLTFQEYFAAIGLLAMDDGLEVLLNDFKDTKSEEVLLLYSGSSKKPETLISRLYSEYKRTSDTNYLLIAGKAIYESDELPIELKSQIVNELEINFDRASNTQALINIQSVLSNLGIEKHIVRTFDEYEIIEELGRGGFATTYKANEKNIDSPIAIKIYHAGTAQYLEKMGEEIKKLSVLKNASLVNLHNVGKKDDQLFVTMEFIEGYPLSTIYGNMITKHQIMANISSQNNILRESENMNTIELGSIKYYNWLKIITKNIIDGVKELHENGLFHGDLKPHNILILNNPKDIYAKVSDYCVDSIVSFEMEHQTINPRVVYSKSYMDSFSTIYSTRKRQFIPQSNIYSAPELRKFDCEWTEAIDIYSLGMIFCDLYLFELPLPADITRPVVDRDFLLKESEVFKKLKDSDVVHIFQKATSKDPKKRFKTVLEFSDILNDITEGCIE